MVDGKIYCKMTKTFKNTSQSIILPLKWVGRGVLMPIQKTSDSTTNPPNSVNNAHDFMPMKIMSLLRYKLHPNI